MRTSRKRSALVVAATASIAALSLAAGAGGASASQCGGVNVTGEGSSLQKGAQDVWDGTTVLTGKGFNRSSDGSACSGTQGTHAKPKVTYNKSGSGTFLKKWHADGSAGTVASSRVAFGGTDDAPTSTQLASIRSHANNSGVVVVPVTQTSMAIVANPPSGCAITQIKNADLEKVFNGTIKQWSGISTASGTCTSAITRVVRADSSGTTYQLKHYLSLINGGVLNGTPPGTTPGKLKWRELQSTSNNTIWPTRSGTLSAVRASLAGGTGPGAGSGGGDEVKTLNRTAGSIGYAALADAKSNISGRTAVLKVQNNGTGTSGAVYADPALGTNANCSGVSYTGVPTGTTGLNLDWSATYGSNTNAGAGRYSICTLTWDVALAKTGGTGGSGFPAGTGQTVHDYLRYVITSTGGQADVGGKYYTSLPGTIATKAAQAVGAIGQN